MTIPRLVALAALALVTSGHVGSPDAWFEGAAGPYLLTVHLEAPPVVPGIAVVNVRPLSEGVERVTAFVNTYDAEGGTPPPDELVPAEDRPGWMRAKLWVMNSGSNSVTIEAHGAAGHGSVVVPLAAVAQRRLGLTPTFVVTVLAGAVVLVWGMLTLVGAAVREGVLEPGELPDEARRRRARRSMTRGAVVIALVLVGTMTWWRAEDRAFQRRLYRPLEIVTRIESSSGSPRLVLAITDSTWLRRNDVDLLRARGELPLTGFTDDHGKLMHLFLVSEDGRAAMAHLHPATQDTVTFTASLPPLPAGTYRVFADVVHLSGFTQTLTSTVQVPAPTEGDSAVLSDDDDSWAAGAAPEASRFTLTDGTTITWLRDGSGTLPVGEDAGLRFLVAPVAGDTAPLEMYLGMPGHAAVVRDDGQVFIHLHPMGTVSPAAQARLTPGPGHSTHVMPMSQKSDTLRFPYAFPAAGRYAVWVQLKRHGRILTGAFVTSVEEPR